MVQIVFMLAVKNPSEQLNALKELMSLIQDHDSMKKIYNCSSGVDVFKVIKDREKISI